MIILGLFRFLFICVIYVWGLDYFSPNGLQELFLYYRQNHLSARPDA